MGILEDTQARFGSDLFATELSNITIEAADMNYAKCRMDVTPRHFNANGFVMGGAIFTLADFAFAVASNTQNPVTVTMTSTINFLSATRAQKLYAEARCDRNSKKVCFFTVSVTEPDGKLIALVSTSGYRKTN